MKVAKFKEYIKGKKVSVIGIGISNRPLIKYLVSLGAEVCAYDKKTEEQLGDTARELKEMGITKPDIRMTADPTLCLIPASDEAVADLLRSRGLDPNGKYICFALRAWKGFSDYSIFTRAARYAYEKHGLTALFLPFEQPTDLKPSRMACEGLETPHAILDGIRDVDLTLALLRRMSAVCAIRLHALVFAAAAGVPFIGVSYDVKVQGFMEYAGNPCCRDLRKIDDAWMQAQIDRAVQEPGFFKDMAAKLRDIERLNKKAAEELL